MANPESESPEPLVAVALIIGGAGGAGAVQGLVKGFAPTLAPEIAGGVAGGLMYYFGDRVHPLVKYLGIGVMAGSLAPAIAKAIPKLGGGSSSSSEHSSSPESPAVIAARNYAMMLTMRRS